VRRGNPFEYGSSTRYWSSTKKLKHLKRGSLIVDEMLRFYQLIFGRDGCQLLKVIGFVLIEINRGGNRKN